MEITIIHENSGVPEKNLGNAKVPLTFINAEKVKGVSIVQQADAVSEIDTMNHLSGDGDTI